ncbi:MAG: helix-turn-helix transcriptional regulator [Lentisphaeria bacterium]|nr:helix-turn-helix transcriptional regulator [Lentisphaeria bacterium]
MPVRFTQSHEIHYYTSQIREIHEKYGLWIINGARGYASRPDSFTKGKTRYFEFYSLSHMYAGKGCFMLSDGKKIEMKPGDCALISPKELHNYGGYQGESYIEDSICFVGPIADQLYASGVLQSGVYHLGNVRKLSPIIDLSHDPAPGSQIKANIALQKLFFELYEKRIPDPKQTLLEDVISLLKENPARWYSVTELAELCNISDDTLRRLFQQEIHMNPKEYMESLKLNHAAEQLICSSATIQDIARSCGYNDPFHFSRRFKLFIGSSPMEYRKNKR